MYHGKIDAAGAVPITSVAGLSQVADERTAPAIRCFAALIILASPFLLLALLARLVWDDVVAIGRALAIFHRAAAEELTHR